MQIFHKSANVSHSVKWFKVTSSRHYVEVNITPAADWKYHQWLFVDKHFSNMLDMEIAFADNNASVNNGNKYVISCTEQ